MNTCDILHVIGNCLLPDTIEMLKTKNQLKIMDLKEFLSI